MLLIKKPNKTAPKMSPPQCDDVNERCSTTEFSRLQNTFPLIKRQKMPEQWKKINAIMCTDGIDSTNFSNIRSYRIAYYDIGFTAFSIVMRAVTVFLNIQLAYTYYQQGEQNYFYWTSISIVVPMCITTLMYANMCYQDGKFSQGIVKASITLWIVFLSSFFFRFLKSLVYSIKCKRAENKRDCEAQLKYFKLTQREESDVALIRIFECFLESAPQKILQISIALSRFNNMPFSQILAIIGQLASMAWCLVVYHRYNRYVQVDKYNINLQGLVTQISWHFCITVSRTFCIALVACLFPLWTIVACLCHSVLYGFVTFIVDRPQFAKSCLANFFFCLGLGIVYLFTYISVKDGPTRLKYIIYYVTCSVENVLCVSLFLLLASSSYISITFLHCVICGMSLAFYCIGITFMIIYYTIFHPNITARQSKRLQIN